MWRAPAWWWRRRHGQVNGRQHRRNASERTVDVVQDLFVFQSQHALAVVLLSAVGLTLEQELIALYIQVHPTAV